MQYFHCNNGKRCNQQSKNCEIIFVDGHNVSTPFYILSFIDSLKLQRISAETWVKEKFPLSSSLDPIKRKKSVKKIRIGYYSADFHNHVMSYLLVNLFELHNKSAFEIYGFSFGPEKNDEMHQRIKNTFAKFINIKFESNNELASV